MKEGFKKITTYLLAFLIISGVGAVAFLFNRTSVYEKDISDRGTVGATYHDESADLEGMTIESIVEDNILYFFKGYDTKAVTLEEIDGNTALKIVSDNSDTEGRYLFIGSASENFVFEADIMIDSFTCPRGVGIRFNPTSKSESGFTGYEGFSLQSTTSPDRYTIMGMETVKCGEWVNLRYEIDGFEQGSARRILVNGEAIAEATISEINTELYGLALAIYGADSESLLGFEGTIYLDNIYVGPNMNVKAPEADDDTDSDDTVVMPGYYGKGLYASHDATLTYSEEENGYLYVSSDSSKAFAVATDTISASENTKYVFETDFCLNAFPSALEEYWLAYFTLKGSDGLNLTTQSARVSIHVNDGRAWLLCAPTCTFSSTTGEPTASTARELILGDWYNIRIELDWIADDSGTYSRYISVYLNGERITSSVDKTGVTLGKDLLEVSLTPRVTFNYSLDNLFVGVVEAETESN